MTTLATVLRGIRSRGLLSVSSLLMMALAIAGAVLGPAFQQAATTSYTLTRVADTPAPLTALTYEVDPGAGRGPDLDALVATATDELERLLPDDWGAPEVTLLTQPVPRAVDFVPVTYLAREGACDLLEIRGRCPSGPREVLVNEDDLFSLAIGDRIEAPLLGRPTIVGTYRTPTTSDDWLLPARLGSRVGTESYVPAPYVVSPDVVAGLPRRLWEPVLESRLSVPERIDDAGFDTLVSRGQALRSLEADLPGGGRLVGTSEVFTLGSVLDDVRRQRDAARAAVTPAVVSLVLVALAMVLRLQTATAELRSSELALAALRGVGRRRSWVLGLLEPWLLVLLSLPLGLAVGWWAAVLLARSGLREGLAVPLPAASVVGAVVVALVTAAVAAIAVGQGMRESLGARLAGVRRPRGGARTGLVVELVVVLVAVLLPLARLGTDRDSLGLTELLLPVALAVAAGLLVTRAAGAGARWWTARGAERPLSVFVAARAVARRSQGTLVILPVTAALAVAVFAVGVDSVADRWRDSVAATTSPADQVWSSPRDLDETVRLTREVDPEGRWTMAAAGVSVPGTGPIVLVDAARLARVGHWSPQWLPGGGGAADAAALVEPAAPLVTLTGRRVVLTVESDAPVTVTFDVRTSAGPGFLRVGPFRPGATTRTAVDDDCLTGCELRRLRVDGATGPVRITGLATENGAVPLVATGWSGSDGERARVEGDTLVVEPDAELVPAAVAQPLRAVLGVRADDTVVEPDGVPAVELSSGPAAVEVTSRAESVPLAGPSGVMFDLTTFLARDEPAPALVDPLVLVRDDAPGEVTTALGRAGLVREAGATETRRALDDSAYAQALRLYVVVGAAILLMALGGLLVSTAVQLPDRRRDAASLRVVGIGRRTVVLASLWESVVVLGAAAVAGLAAGVLAQAVLLRSLTLGLVDDGTTPRVLADPDRARLVLLAVGVTGVLLLVAGLSAVAVVRRARAATLRETAR